MKKSKRSIKKIHQKKTQHKLDRQTAKTSAWSSGSVGQHEFLLGNYVIPDKGLLVKVATIKSLN